MSHTDIDSRENGGAPARRSRFIIKFSNEKRSHFFFLRLSSTGGDTTRKYLCHPQITFIRVDFYNCSSHLGRTPQSKERRKEASYRSSSFNSQFTDTRMSVTNLPSCDAGEIKIHPGPWGGLRGHTHGFVMGDDESRAKSTVDSVKQPTMRIIKENMIREIYIRVIFELHSRQGNA